MITLYEFNAMNTSERADAVWNGVFIGDRTENNLSILLYNMDTFYAEVFYDPQTNEIIRIRGFKSTKLIEPYLENIQIDL